MKNKKVNQNLSGIVVSDNITMSVQKKRPNLRLFESAIIAFAGFAAVILSFPGIFEFTYSVASVVAASVILSVTHLIFALCGKKNLVLSGISLAALIIVCYKKFGQISMGFKFVYNLMYSQINNSAIKYYKHLNPDLETQCVTLFFIVCIWLIALVIFNFTVYRPNLLPIILVTFPILEINLYYGVEVPVFWGILTIAYWLAVFCMCSIDLGEYSGGSGGFVRKDNLFFPKRQMRLKVTEKCGLMVMTSLMIAGITAMGVMKLTDYKRSNELNQKRRDIKEAVNNFSMEDLASSVSDLTEAFGLTITYDTHKLGTFDHMSYKDVVDLVTVFDKKYSGAIYLKGYAGAVYDDNEWETLPQSAYDNASTLFEVINSYGISPHDFPYILTNAAMSANIEAPNITTLWIEAKRKKNKSYAPYATYNYDRMTYDSDNTVSTKTKKSSSYSYKFLPMEIEDAVTMLDDYAILDFTDSTDRNVIDLTEKFNLVNEDGHVLVKENILPFATAKKVFAADSKAAVALIIENQYREFVYENYLQVPDTKAMDEVYEAYSDIFTLYEDISTAKDRLKLLEALRNRMRENVTYTLSPGKTPSNRDFVNYFLLENKQGYCSHYATSGAMLARMAGIPARYATGYIVVGDDFTEEARKSDNSYEINVMDNRGHAWAEVYLDGFGWVPFEFTAGYSSSTINTEPASTTTAPTTESTEETSTVTTAEDYSGTSTDSEETRRPSNNSDENETTAETNVGTVTATFPNGGGGQKPSEENERGIHINMKAVGAVVIVLAVVGGFFLRRSLILKKRQMSFTSGNEKQRILAIYRYSENLMDYLNIHQGSLQPKDFAKLAEERLAPDYFPVGEFVRLTDTALMCAFGDSDPEKNATEDALRFTQDFADKLYSKAKIHKKLYLKMILVLI